MSDLRPLGSERLQGDDKIKRIMELANYGRDSKVISENKVSSSTLSVEYIKESKTGVYGIVREKSSYYVKKGLNESSLDYIGGIFMKDKNRFSSYADALKRLELISGQETISEATKYVLKSKEKPVESIPSVEPMDEPQLPAPVEGPSDSEIPSVDSAEEPIGDDTPDEEPMDDMGGEEEGKRSDYMAEAQKFAGKLGQELRDLKEKMESDDIKYILNMIISAVDLDKLDDEDIEDIAKKFERDEESMDSMDDMGDEESPEEEIDEPTSPEDELDEIMNKLESFVNTPVESTDELGEEDDVLNMADLGVNPEEVEESDIQELDLDEIKNEINKHVGETLSKYFK